MLIPKIIHFIWVGKSLPTARRDNILEWAKKNAGFKINLWVDSKGAEINSIFGAPFENAVNTTVASIPKHLDTLEIKDIQEMFIDNTNQNFYWECIRYEIDKLRPNYGAASDLLRLVILEKIGGAYYDLDVNPVCLADIDIWNNDASEILWMNKKECNDIMICTPNNPTLKVLRNGIVLNQKTLKDTTMMDLTLTTYLTDNPFYIVSNTLNKTGPNAILSLNSKLNLREITENLNLRKVTQPESAQDWCGREVKTLDDSDCINLLYAKLLRLIQFEVETLEVLRLEDHVNNFIECVYIIDENEKQQHVDVLLEKIAQLDLWNKIQHVQLTFVHQKVFEFYQQKHLLNKTHLLPWDLRIISLGTKNVDVSIDRLLNIVNLFAPNTACMHQFVSLIMKRYPYGDSADPLRDLIVELKSEMINSQHIFSIHIKKYLAFIVRYIKNYDRDTYINEMLNFLEKIIKVRLKFFNSYLCCVDQFLGMDFLLCQLRASKKLDNIIMDNIKLLQSESNSNINVATFEANFEANYESIKWYTKIIILCDNLPENPQQNVLYLFKNDNNKMNKAYFVGMEEAQELNYLENDDDLSNFLEQVNTTMNIYSNDENFIKITSMLSASEIFMYADEYERTKYKEFFERANVHYQLKQETLEINNIFLEMVDSNSDNNFQHRTSFNVSSVATRNKRSTRAAQP